MNRRTFLATPLAAPAAALQPAAPARMAGFAERDITPAIGMEQPGGYSKSFHRSFHDPCKVRASVFDDGTRRVALVGVDALVVPRGVVQNARRRIREQCGIAEECVMIGASHSHSSGPVGMVLPGEYDHASEFVRKLAYEESSMADAGYLRRLETEIVNAVGDASAKRRPVRVGFGSGSESKVGFNRRFRMKNGQTWTHPGKGNPDVLKPAGPIDPEVGVIGVWDANDKLAGCVVNYACHATTSPGGISANWICYLEKTIRGSLDPEAVVVFLQGFSGDVTQVDNIDRHANPKAGQWAKIVGGRVGAEAVKVLLSMTPGEVGPVAAQREVLSIPRRLPSPARVARCTQILKTGKPGSTDWLFAKEIVMLAALAEKARDVEAEIQAVQVGPAVFVSAPGEMFCQSGLDIKAAKAFPLTYPVELANGCVGYVPTEEALGPRGGGYETRLTAYSNLVPDAGTRMVRKGIELARRLTPGRMPEAPLAPAFNAAPGGLGTAPWTYGNVPPELS